MLSPPVGLEDDADAALVLRGSTIWLLTAGSPLDEDSASDILSSKS